MTLDGSISNIDITVGAKHAGALSDTLTTSGVPPIGYQISFVCVRYRFQNPVCVMTYFVNEAIVSLKPHHPVVKY